ncbi:MAG: restriction endonuclease subunit S, partial [Ignavibacteria bacterium]|nr:restriction endonuclease subunit S [Ignavibacteria bacterium]
LCCCIPFESLSTKTALPSMTQTALYQIKMPIPPIDEQKQIVSHIKTETATIDTAIAKAEREIELIREYKEAMVSEAVMGKIL